MTEQALGLAGALEPGAKIYYENVFSQLQCGRAIDLFSALALESGVPMSPFRTALSTALNEACRCHALYNTALPTLDPVTIEYGGNASKTAISVVFSVTDEYLPAFEDQFKTAKPGEGIAVLSKLCKEVTLKFHRKSKRVELLCVLSPAPESSQQTQAAIRFIELADNAPIPDTKNEYVELGDVEYVQLLAEEGEGPRQNASTAKKILEAATSVSAKAEAELSSEIDRRIEKNHSDTEVISALSDSANVDQMNETIKRNLSTGQICDLIAKENPETVIKTLSERASDEQFIQAMTAVISSISPEKSAELLREALTQDELSGIVKAALSQKEQAAAIANAMPKEELEKLLSGSLNESEKASVLAAGNPEATGKILGKSMTRDQMHKLITESLPAEEKAKAIVRELEPAEVAEVLCDHLDPAEKAKLLAKFDPKATVELLKKNLSDSQLSKLLAEQLSDEDHARLLKGLPIDEDESASGAESEADTEAVEQAEGSDSGDSGVAQANRTKAKTLAKGHEKFAAKVLKQLHSPAETAKLLKESLTEEEQGKVLSEGLSPEEVHEILSRSVSGPERMALLAKANPEEAARIFKENASSDQIERLMKRDLPRKELAQAVAKSYPEGELARMVRGTMAEPELARMVRGGLPEPELARIVKGSLPEADIAHIIKNGLSEPEIARIVEAGCTEAEILNIIRAGTEPKVIAEKILSGSSPEKAAELLHSALTPQQIGEAIATSLPPAMIARTAAAALSPQELFKLTESSMPKEKLSEAVSAGLTPDQLVSAIGTFAQDDSPGFLQALRARYKPEEMVDILSTGLSKKDLARVLTSALPREAYATVLAEGLPPQEIAQTLSEGLPKEKFALLISAALPQRVLSEVVAKNPIQDSRAPDQSYFQPVQVAALLRPSLNEVQALSALSSILPRSAAEGFLAGATSGTIPMEEVTRTLQQYLPNPELAEKIASNIARARPSEGPGAESGAENPAAQTAKTTPSSRKPASGGSTTNEKQLAAAKKSIEFYTNRTRNLETQLRAAEDKIRKSKQESEKSKQELERVLSIPESSTHAQEDSDGSRSVSEQKQPSDEAPSVVAEKADAAPSAPGAKDKNATYSEFKAKKDQESIRFFQKKAHEFEAELRKSESEIRRLTAEHTKELLSHSPAAAGGDQNASVKKNLELHANRVKELEAKLRSSDELVRRSQQDALKTKKELERVLSLPDDTVSDPAETASERRPPSAQTHHEKPARIPDHGEKPSESAVAMSKKAQESVRFFQNKSHELEGELRKAEAEIKLLKAALKGKPLAPANNEAQERPDRRSTASDQQHGEKPDQPLETNDDPKPDPRENDIDIDAVDAPSANVAALHRTQARPQDRGVEANAQQARTIQNLQARIVELEQQLQRQREWQLKNAEKISRAPVGEYGSGPGGGATAAFSPTDEPEAPASLESENADTETAPAAKHGHDVRPNAKEDEISLPEEAEINKVGQKLDTIAKKMEYLKTAIPEDRAKRIVDGLMTEIMHEKSRLAVMTRELTANFRKQSLSFKNQEAILREDLKQTRTTAIQRQAGIDMLKRQLHDLQHRVEREKAISDEENGTESQIRIKYEQSQRQIELLNKEIERANRRLQAPGMQNSAATQGEMSELKKQIEISKKAVHAKIKELDLLKQQMSERDKREAELKRQIMKLQNELTVAKRAA